MKFYTQPGIPNPDVVHMFAEETGCTGLLEIIPMNVGKGDNRTAEFYKKNPLGEVPALDMENGVPLSESVAIAYYLNEKMGGSSIVGLTPEERAETEMWLRRVQDKILMPIGLAFQSGPLFNFFKDRRPGYIHKEIVEPNRIAGKAGLTWLNDQLADGRKFLCGDRFSLADIRFYVLYAFYSKMDKSQAEDPSLKHLAAYLQRIRARPSATAIIPKKSKL